MDLCIIYALLNFDVNIDVALISTRLFSLRVHRLHLMQFCSCHIFADETKNFSNVLFINVSICTGHRRCR